MRSQTTTSRKRGRETTPVRTTRLKTGRHQADIKHDAATISFLMDQEEEEEELNILRSFRPDSPSSTVIGPLSSNGRQLSSSSSSDHQPPPSKSRKQQQQVANGFPVTVFPPADNNNSSPPPGGPFQSRNNSSSKNRVATTTTMKNSSSQATVRLDNNKPEPSASRKEAPPTRRDAADEAVAASIRRQQMKEAFQPWVMQTYGDAAKTKTISRRKSERIVRILKGEDRSNGADSSKFRFWVRAKGFRLGPPPETLSSSSTDDAIDDLYVVTSTTKDEMGGEDRPVYKKVAVVEDFFDIIYREHVEFMNNSGGRPPTGKHAGQKRTYRAITEIYAFLPREAVTRFLMQCADCQRRGNGAAAAASSGNNGAVSPPSTQLSPSTTLLGVSPGSPTPPASPHTPANNQAPTTKPAPHHHHHPPLLLPPTPPQQQQQHQFPLMLAVTTNNIDLSLPLTSTLLKRATLAGVSHDQLLGLDRAESTFCSAGTSSPQQGMTAVCKVEDQIPAKRNNPSIPAMTAPTSPITLDLSSKSSDILTDDHSPGAIKDDDDDDDDDVEDRIDTQDPERLKAFNMFVRLFVDENLDRMVPISRQPREKVQAIIDSCLRQFPEFGERARKRIRTYLKSCRRHKRTRDSSGSLQMDPSVSSGGLLSPNRPMPPHLTSAVAEQILAQACENENQNAKRLRLGLEPISQPLPVGHNDPVASSPAPEAHSPVTTSTATTNSTNSGTANLFRPAFGPYQRSNNVAPPPTSIHQGPTDLSTKVRSTPAILGPPTSNGLSSRSSPLPHKLNAAEILAVRQLVTGYRESAAFLLRSADELEQLLHQQQTAL